MAGLLCAGALGLSFDAGSLAAEKAPWPVFSPTVKDGWIPDRPTGDDFLAPLSGAGPVMSDPAHPYVPNGGGRQPTYRVADLTNSILQPWAATQMKKANDEVLAG